MCDPISAAIVGSAVIGAGTSVYSGAKQAKAAKKGARQAEMQAAEERARQTRENNRLNQKTPDLGVISGMNALRNSSGIGSTMLTSRIGSSISSALGGGVQGLLGSTSALGG